MNGKRKVDGGRGTRRSRLSMQRSWSAAALHRLGFLAGVLVISALLAGTAFAADGAAVPCEVCGEAYDPVQYSFMARLEGSESGVGAVNIVPRTLADASDPLQYTFAASRSASLAQNAEISRLRGLAGPGAGSWSRVNEVVHLRGLVEAARSSTGGVARAAEIARLRGLAGPGAGSWSKVNEEAHLRGLAEAARDSVAGVDCAVLGFSTRAQQASAARLTGLANWYLGEEFVVGAELGLPRGRLVDAARLTALGAYVTESMGEASPRLLCQLGP